MGQDEEQRHVCRHYNENFSSGRVLGGHMNKNSAKGQRNVINSNMCFEGGGRSGYGLRENPKKSLRALTSHKRIHSQRFDICNESWISSSLGLVRKKRSNRMRYKIRPNSSFSSLDESVSVSFTEIEKEVKDIAICLMMLSRGATDWGGFNSVTESSDNDFVYPNVPVIVDVGF
ncbi:uncharacterized protein LOC132183287 [Corylus avellana]|uniref:uncharacterized protein LOC132183287 n=1 Tax=Corylus avellana TaxID=13451 RepID=UPI001E203DFA|nr:uncharacterized protein LOC132183287 [Corylus avellana]